ncbi:hypothetical protein [Corynebacterium glyciniphilum]|uniref:hypothetical protein n=1 Tax=Corynebacterium glyciniphilum TaxID=1404244 RepID=UPI003FD6A718
MTTRLDALTRKVQRASGVLTSAKRFHPEDDHADLERAVSAARVQHAVTKIMAESPALTAEQVASIVAVLQHQDHTAVGDAA